MENLFKIRLQKTLSEFEKEFRKVGIYYKKCSFSCYESEVFTYSVKKDKTLFEISFICDDTLLKNMTCKELLDLKRISFYNVRIFSLDTMECISDIKCKK